MKRALLLAAMIFILTANFAFALSEGKEYFVKTALHAVRGDEIYWVNYTDKSILIGTGEKVLITSISGHKIKFELGGKTYSFAFTEKGNSGTDELYNKFFTERDIKDETAKYPADIKDKIKRGVAEKGMTKEQVLRAVGCPALAGNQKTYNLTLKEIMASDRWIYYFNRFNRWQAEFKDGRLVDIKN